jgi:hypothetical protein
VAVQAIQALISGLIPRNASLVNALPTYCIDVSPRKPLLMGYIKLFERDHFKLCITMLSYIYTQGRTSK